MSSRIPTVIRHMSRHSRSSKIQPQRARLAALFYPAPGLTYEQFHDYWANVHGKDFLAMEITKKNLLKYEQFYFNLSLNAKLSEGMHSSRSPFWGMAIFEAETMEKITAVLESDEYMTKVFPEEPRMFDRSKCQVLGGTFATLWEKDKAMLKSKL